MNPSITQAEVYLNSPIFNTMTKRLFKISIILTILFICLQTVIIYNEGKRVIRQERQARFQKMLVDDARCERHVNTGNKKSSIP